MAKKDKRKSRAGEDEEGSSGKASKVASVSASAAPLSFDAELDALFSSASRQPEPAAPAASSSRNKSSVEEEVDKAAITSMEDEDEDEEEEEEEEPANIVVNETGVGQEVVQDSEDDSDANGPPPVHETLLKRNAKSPAKVFKKKPAKPTLELRLEQDSHSLFVGNLPLSLATSKGDMKALKRHLVACSPYPFITIVKAVRLRSIPFSKPTDDYQADDPESAERGQKRRDRARAWKETEGGTVKDQEAGSKGKVFLNAKQKRKVAYIQGEVNEKADALNAYVTIDLAGQRRLDAYAQRYNADVSKLTDKTLAALMAFTSNNTLFRGRHIRCDLVRSLETSAILSAGLDQVRTPNGSLLGQSMGTNAAAMDINMRRRTIFVGNVDFEAKEEEVREFFEALVRRERGMPPEVKALDFSACRTLPKPESEQKPATASDAESQSASESEAESASGGEESAEEDNDEDEDEDEEREAREEQAARPSSTKAEPYWVESVRLIRDSATQMGKGIAYVRFTDSTSVDELMAISEAENAFLEASKMGKTTSKLGTSKLELNNGNFKRRLKFKGKPLRLSRCKAATNSQASTPNKRHAAATGGGHSRQRSAGAPTPGGTSPSSVSRQNSNARAPNETPLRNKGSLSKGTPLSKPSPKSSIDSTQEKKIEVANPPPKRTDAAFMAKKAEKRADADRAAKRMEKKRKKVEERKLSKKIEGDVGTSGKVKLKMGGSKKKQGGAPSSKTKKRGALARLLPRASLATLSALCILSLAMITSVQANTEIVNFGPVMCRADESGHLEGKAARDVSGDWPVLRPSSNPRLFTITPSRVKTKADGEHVESYRGAWFTLQLADPALDEVVTPSEPTSTTTAAQTQESRVAAVDLATEAFPLLSRGHDTDIPPRDRFVAGLWNHTEWWLTRRYTLRASWAANFPNSIHLDVHSPRTMLETGNIKWAAKGKSNNATTAANVSSTSTTGAAPAPSASTEGQEEAEETLAESHQDPEWLERDADTPFWPCPRLYVHVYSTFDGVPIPRPPSAARSASTFSTIIARLAEALMGTLQNIDQLPLPIAQEGFFMASSEEEGGKLSPMPFHIVFEPLDVGAVPRTAWSLLAVLAPALILVLTVGHPLISRRLLRDARPREKTE